MTAARRRSLAPLLPEEDTVILLTGKNNTIHHPPLPLHDFVLLRVCLCPSESPERTENPQVRLSSEVDPIRSTAGRIPEGVIYLDQTPEIFLFLDWWDIISRCLHD